MAVAEGIERNLGPVPQQVGAPAWFHRAAARAATRVAFVIFAHAALGPLVIFTEKLPGWMYAGATYRDHPPFTSWQVSESPRRPELLAILGFLVIVLIEGLLTRTLYRAARRNAAGEEEWIAHWAKCWLWVLLAAFVLGPLTIRPGLGDIDQLAPLICAFVVVGPTVMAGKRRRPARWRPVCPDCGHSVRRVARLICNECGARVEFTPNEWRRSAVLRLAWDRRPIGGWISAYVRTLLAMLLTPGQAGERIAADDRWRRAWSWAGLNWLVIFTAVVAVEGIHQLITYLFTPPAPPDLLIVEIPELEAASWRYFQSVITHAAMKKAFFMLATMAGVALAAALLWADPRLDRRTRRLAWKWTLYCAGLLPWFGVFAILADNVVTGGKNSWALSGWTPYWVPGLLLPFLVVWSLGLRRLFVRQARLREDWLVRTAVYAGVWWAMVLFVAPPGVWWCLLW
jgi:hypothetical protein